ncbi:L,D-transpeptidase [Acidisphaera sp. L21]|uniref:L,D-transpeptidase family protein n=1 Tax=Acidisphaera sp. L21 TaxID=1641851 RepID=UPI00131ECD86|nr:L,D-transpeptidase family protein [Acidisphaera sp. L21]
MQAVVLGDGFLRIGPQQWRCCLGAAGMRLHKQEGDSASPIGLLPLRRVLYRADRGPAPETAAPVEPIGRNDGWCDDPTDRAYNRPVRLPHSARYEELWRDDGLYDIVGILGWNDDPVQRNNGSAIFLHIARPDYAPTEGCVALALRDLREVLAAGLSAVQIGPVQAGASQAGARG